MLGTILILGVGCGRKTQEIGGKDLRTRKALEEKVVGVGGFRLAHIFPIIIGVTFKLQKIKTA